MTHNCEKWSLKMWVKRPEFRVMQFNLTWIRPYTLATKKKK
jgi:hypothetical protein